MRSVASRACSSSISDSSASQRPVTSSDSWRRRRTNQSAVSSKAATPKPIHNNGDDSQPMACDTSDGSTATRVGGARVGAGAGASATGSAAALGLIGEQLLGLELDAGIRRLPPRRWRRRPRPRRSLLCRLCSSALRTSSKRRSSAAAAASAAAPAAGAGARPVAARRSRRRRRRSGRARDFCFGRRQQPQLAALRSAVLPFVRLPLHFGVGDGRRQRIEVGRLGQPQRRAGVQHIDVAAERSGILPGRSRSSFD